MKQIVNEIRQALRDSGKSQAELCREIGVSPGYISHLFSGKIEEPSASVFLKMCRALHLSADEVGGMTHSVRVAAASEDYAHRVAAKLFQNVMSEAKRRLETAAGRPTTDDVLAWWRREEGMLRDYDAIRDSIGIFKVPEATDNAIIPRHVGPQSLAAECFSVQGREELISVISRLSRDVNERLTSSYAETNRDGPKMSVEKIEFRQPGKDVVLEFEYMRTLLPVKDEATGAPMILNFSKFIV